MCRIVGESSCALCFGVRRAETTSIHLCLTVRKGAARDGFAGAGPAWLRLDDRVRVLALGPHAAFHD